MSFRIALGIKLINDVFSSLCLSILSNFSLTGMYYFYTQRKTQKKKRKRKILPLVFNLKRNRNKTERKNTKVLAVIGFNRKASDAFYFLSILLYFLQRTVFLINKYFEEQRKFKEECCLMQF